MKLPVEDGGMKETVDEKRHERKAGWIIRRKVRSTFAGSLVSEMVLSAAAASVWGSCVTEKLP